MATKPVTFFNFAGGINSEATPLNIPPTDLIECTNAKVNRNGSLERRGGCDLLDSGEANTTVTIPGSTITIDNSVKWLGLPYYASDDAGLELTYAMWDAPVSTKYVQIRNHAGELKKYFVMVAGKYANFYDVSNPNTLRDIGTPSYTFEMSNPFGDVAGREPIPGVPDPRIFDGHQFYKTQIFADRNKVFFINPVLPMFYVFFNEENNLTTSELKLYTRDLNSKISDDVVFLPTDPDVWNNDWNSALVYICRKTHTEADITPAATYITLAEAQASEYYPPTHPDLWEFWDKRDRESVLSIIPSWPPVPNAYSVNAFGYNVAGYAVAGSRTYKSNITQILDTGLSYATGFSTGCVSAGRLWLTGWKSKSNSVMFSQVVRENEDYRYGYFYQRADPRSFSSINDTDIVDTDGGEIVINDASSITALLPYREGVLAFAENGVWYISGETGFKPTNYRVEKISDKGALNAWSVVSNDNFVFYAAYDDIYTITTTKDFRSLEAAAITPKIHTLLNDIPIKNRLLSLLTLNAIEQKLYYFYNDIYDWVVYNNKHLQPCHFRKALVFDIPTQSWYEWELEEDIVGTELALIHMEALPLALLGDNEQVFDESYALVEQEFSPINRTVEVYGEVTNNIAFTNICVFGKPAIAQGEYRIAFGFFETQGLQDFEQATSDTASFSTSVKFAYQHFGDTIRNKGVPYVQMLFKRTETGEMDTETNTDLREGGCLGRFIFYWTNGSRGPKYGDEKQLYYSDRMTQTYFNNTNNDTYIVTHKQKLRGFGENFQVELTNDGNKPFHLYGWEILVRGFARE